MAEENWLITDNSKIFYRKKGKGPTVALIHGFAEDGTIWDKQVAFLQNHFQLIIPDLPGSGRSAATGQQISNIFYRSIDGYATIIKQVLDKEQISYCVMAGHSMGGYITLAFAEKYAATLAAFVLFHSTAYADSDEKKAARKKSIQFIKKNGAAEFIKLSSPNLFSAYNQRHHPDLVRNLVSRYDNFSAGSLVSYYEAMIHRPDRTDLLKNFQRPVQFIIGEGDNAVPLEQSLKQCHLPKITYIHILENTGHMGMWEASDAVNKLLLGFVNQVLA
ncbi:MAG: alpha/beta hydrolase [Bacteroidetes bacterium]|nr:alpha/beta hydrolase [Bacteroidota bacterium]MBS1973971.1 alpha/beta hydrolase [Bacteroidota bacterium]